MYVGSTYGVTKAAEAELRAGLWRLSRDVLIVR